MKQSNNKVINFFKRNAVYVILTLCIVAIGVAATLMLVYEAHNNVPSDSVFDEENKNDNQGENSGEAGGDTGNKEESPDKPTTTVVSFVMPISNATKIEDYSETMTFNSTLGRYTAHLAIDFYAPEGTDVLAVYDGVVEKVETTILEGLSVTINHGNGLKTTYNSLGETDVKEGQTIKTGEVIGTVSTTNRQEYKAGAHLHFQVFENEQIINPEKYLAFEEK